MKIAIDIRCLMGNRYSGVGWYAYNLIKNLLQIDQENEYLLFYNSSKKVDLPKFDYPNVKYCGFNYPNKLFNLSLNFFNYPKLDLLVGGCDLFFSPNFHFLAVSSKVKLVVTVHDLSFLIYPQFFTLKQRLWHQLILSKKILKRADVVLADSISTKTDLIDLLKIENDKIKVNYLGVEERYFNILSSDDLNRIREKYNLPEKFILCLSTIEPRKNLEASIKAFEDLDSDLNLVIAGGNGWKTREVEKMIKNNNKIKFIDYIDEIDKPAVYQLATIFLYPSFYEGFGLPLLEAMASGVSVIAGYNSAQVEVVNDCGLLVDPFDINQIKLALENLINNQELRKEFIDEGKKRAKDFSWQKTAERTLEEFKKIKNI